MDKKDLIDRLHQLRANDMNARSVYSDLADVIHDNSLKMQFEQLAREESAHVALIQSMLELLGT